MTVRERRRAGRAALRYCNDDEMRRAGRRAVQAAVRAGVGLYDRARDLPGLVRADPFAPAPETPEAVRAIVARLERALRAERNRARSGHWTYDLNRHVALRQAYVAETERLAALERAKRPEATLASAG
jgi:hypothetical protein